jgi:hypothetical protein
LFELRRKTSRHVNCPCRFFVSKHTIKIPPLPPGRRVSWTFEVSAAVGAENGARSKKTPRKRLRSSSPLRRKRTSAPQPSPVPAPPQPFATAGAVEAPAVPATAFPAPSVAPVVIAHVGQTPQTPVRRATQLRTVAAAGAAFLVVAVLALPRNAPAPGAEDDAEESQPGPADRPVDLFAFSPRPAALPTAASAPVEASASLARRAASAPSKQTLVEKLEKNRIAESTKSAAPIAAVAPVAVMADAAAKLPESEAIAPPAPPSVAIGTGGTLPVTITGCLEVSVGQDEFRLTDTEGVDAPRSRSWRTGFLKKRSAPVALVEPPDRLALQTHVGRRVAATGLLSSHDLKVSALRVVGASCN